jgi:sulfatase modifying factor 1
MNGLRVAAAVLLAGPLWAAEGGAGAAWTNPLGMTFIAIPAGELMIGTADIVEAAMERPDGSEAMVADEQPRHRVVFEDRFWLGKTEVTQGQWLAVMGGRPGPASHWQRDDWRDLPVVSVTWEGVQAFIEALEARDPAHRYRLPSEAQWEYAARAGREGLRPFPIDELPAHAWYIDNSGDVPHPVATRQANPWGLHDMLGNVWEWTADWYAPDTYGGRRQVDPQGPRDGIRRVRRGGSYHCPVHLTRPGYRAADRPDQAYSVLGFRLVAEPRGAAHAP